MAAAVERLPLDSVVIEEEIVLFRKWPKNDAEIDDWKFGWGR